MVDSEFGGGSSQLGLWDMIVFVFWDVGIIFFVYWPLDGGFEPIPLSFIRVPPRELVPEEVGASFSLVKDASHIRV